MTNFINSKLSGDIVGDLARFEHKVKETVLFAGVAAMAKAQYDQVKAKAEAHKKTGLLSSAIYRVYSPEKSTDSVKTYRISWNKSKAPHGHLIEFGTSRAPAYPFVRPAFDHIQAAIKIGQERMKQQLASGVSGVAE